MVMCMIQRSVCKVGQCAGLGRGVLCVLAGVVGSGVQ